jgi:hypothetical protein
MRGTLLGTDFIYNKNGDLVPTEINTAIRPDIRINTDLSGSNFATNMDGFFSYQNFHSFLQEKGITTIKVIENGGGGYGYIFNAFANLFGYEYQDIIIPANSVTVPDVEDDEQTLVIRIAYDSYSILDDLYCRDMYEFHNLIKYEDFAIPVKFKDSLGLNTILQFKDYVDDRVPNYVVKARVPGYVPTEYPKLYRLDTTDELNALKASIGENEFLSEYLWNAGKLVNDRTTFIRSTDLIWGDELNVLNLFTYKAINQVSVNNEKLVYSQEIDANKKLDDLFASKYYPSWFSKTGLSYHFDETDMILLANDGLKLAKDLNDTDTIIGIHFNEDLSGFSAQPDTVISDFVTGNAKLGGVTSNRYPGIFVNITVAHPTYGEFSWFDGAGTPYLIRKALTNEVKYLYEGAGILEAGDDIYIYDKSVNQVIPFSVTDITFEIKPQFTYLLSLGKIDGEETGFSEFLIQITNDTHTEETSNLFLIQHNTCNSTICYFTPGPKGGCGNANCTTCGKNSTQCIDCGGATVVNCFTT